MAPNRQQAIIWTNAYPINRDINAVLVGGVLLIIYIINAFLIVLYRYTQWFRSFVRALVVSLSSQHIIHLDLLNINADILSGIFKWLLRKIKLVLIYKKYQKFCVTF